MNNDSEVKNNDHLTPTWIRGQYRTHNHKKKKTRNRLCEQTSLNWNCFGFLLSHWWFPEIQCNVLSACERTTFRQCGDVKKVIPAPPSGVYIIKPDSHQPSFRVYCDFDEADFSWTKILQISQNYTVTPESSGDVAANSNFTQSAKLSDQQINSIASALKTSGKSVFYRVTASDAPKRVYAQSDKAFIDTARGWNIFSGNRRQCLSYSYRSCSMKFTSFQTLDTLHDGTGDEENSRFFTDHDHSAAQGLQYFRCWLLRSTTMRCVNSALGVRYQVEMWIGAK